jgi:hypothetical protein
MRLVRVGRLFAIAVAFAFLSSPLAQAAGPPQVGSGWVTEVTASAATLRALINPEGSITKYRFEYISEAAFQANLVAIPPREGFAGASIAPTIEGALAAGSVDVPVAQHIIGLTPVTPYHYRVRATNASGPTFGPAHVLTTQETALTFSLPDRRGWEMVSPIDKNGGAIESVGTTAKRVLQASADGNRVTYDSVSAFGDAQGAPNVSQYRSQRGGSGWATEDLTIPLFSGSYGDEPSQTPYRLFSPDLSLSLVSNGERCRGSDGECAVANPPLPGTDAPAGYMNYYRRNDAGGFQALLSQAQISDLIWPPQRFELHFAAASPDLGHVLLSSCAALTADATEEPGLGSCDPASPNLYEWSGGSTLRLVNLLPGQTEGSPGAAPAAQGRAVSADGSRVFWKDLATGNLYLRKDDQSTVQVDAGVAGGSAFQTASSDGSVAYFTKGGHLYRFDVGTEATTDLTPTGGVEGVLGASDDGSYVYYLATAGLVLWHSGSSVTVAATADASNYPPTTGTARVTPDGRHLAFVASASLTGYDNVGKTEVFVYGQPPGGGAPTLQCASCNPTGERPIGASRISGAIASGTGSTATEVYKPRALTADGSRVFFDSEDALVVQDTDAAPDVYEWQAQGAGGCGRASGCALLLSSGRSLEGASFVDASANGSDAFFLTDGSLVPQDPGLVDLYDAREGGGFPVPASVIPCNGDACQSLPEAPEDPTPGTLVPNPGNPVAPPMKKQKKKKQGKKKQKKKQGKKAKRASKRRAGR